MTKDLRRGFEMLEGPNGVFNDNAGSGKLSVEQFLLVV